MTVDIRQPNITGKTEQEQLAQIKSYLYQFAGQLQWALNNIESGGSTTEVTKGSSSAVTESNESPASTFNQVKGLIIKSADIVNAYYEQMNHRLKGEYVAQSEFGDYMESTTLEIDGTPTDITQIFTDLQQIISTVEGIEDAMIATNAYIKSGLLTYGDDGAPVYGLEVGQTNTIDGVETFNKFARFTADRLSFYDANDIEVAYVSDYRLVITNAEIKGQLKLGGYVMDTTNGIALKWEGR